MKILSTRRFASWWQLARRWFEKQFSDQTDVIRSLISQASAEDVREMFDNTPPPVEGTITLSSVDASNTDAHGYIIVDEIPVDDNGYVKIAETGVDEDGYITE